MPADDPTTRVQRRDIQHAFDFERIPEVEYRDVSEIPGLRVGRDGSLWSRRKSQGFGWGKGSKAILTEQWKQLSPCIAPNGYRQTGVRINGTTKTFYVHHLVAKAFHGPCPPGMECRHLDGNPMNNRADNLCWGTPTENTQDQIRHGTFAPAIKRKRFNEEEVREIRRLYATGDHTHASLAVAFGAGLNTIGRLLQGKSWRNIQ